jgi:ribose 1,5-bisphosphate isomerase
MDFNKIVKDIKDLKIQSAENVSKNALIALKKYANSIDTITKTRFFEEINKAKSILFKTRPTEPCMRNAINYVLHDFDALTLERLKEKFSIKINQALNHLENAESIISEIGARKIKNDSKIFTHCHSSSVMAVLKKAKNQNKNLEVYNTETRPKFQGRITALELIKAKIPVTHYVDSSARLAIKNANIMMIGCDAIDSEGKCYNKVGSEMFAEIANKLDVPVYIVTDSWKFDPRTVFGFNEEIEKRSSKEIWPNAPKQIKIENFAFEKIDPKLISGIISEIGIFKPQMFVEEIKSKYSFMFT